MLERFAFYCFFASIQTKCKLKLFQFWSVRVDKVRVSVLKWVQHLFHRWNVTCQMNTSTYKVEQGSVWVHDRQDSFTFLMKRRTFVRLLVTSSLNLSDKYPRCSDDLDQAAYKIRETHPSLAGCKKTRDKDGWHIFTPHPSSLLTQLHGCTKAGIVSQWKWGHSEKWLKL